MRGDLDAVEESSFLVGFEVLSFDFPESTLWRREFCVENNSRKVSLSTMPHFFLVLGKKEITYLHLQIFITNLRITYSHITNSHLHIYCTLDFRSELGCSKRDPAKPGLAGILSSVL